MQSLENRAADPAKSTHADAPDWLLGLWRRESLLFPDGSGDFTTNVHWGQTRKLFVDLRIPKERPATAGRKSFAEYSLQELQELAEQKGFAGHIVIEGSSCSWVRYIDYRPDTGRSDAGRLRIDGDTLYEEGDPNSILASAYQEVYQRMPSATALYASLRMVAHEPSASAGFDWTGAVLVMIGDRFLFARPRRRVLPRAETLRALVAAAGNDRALIHGYLDCEISLGRVDGGDRPWEIAESTLPFREKSSLWHDSATHRSGDDQVLLQECDWGRCLWRVHETSEPIERLAECIDR
jgi:hypothetical protein